MLYHIIYLPFVSLLVNLSTYAAESENNPRVEQNGQELILCRKCGADIADTNYIFSNLSPGATKIENRKLFGKQNLTVQTLINPYEVQFEIITLERAQCDNVGHEQGADSWFPGYTWRICACKHCGQHLGWTFKRSDHSQSHVSQINNQIQSFTGLILSNILGENFTDSLLLIPKMYKM